LSRHRQSFPVVVEVTFALISPTLHVVAVALLVATPPPEICNKDDGLVVPMPTLPRFIFSKIEILIY